MFTPEFWSIWIASLVGTTLMTIFSMVLGILMSKEFSEPKLLQVMFRPKNKNLRRKNEIGWITHYLMGVFFAWSIWFCTDLIGGEYTYLNALFLGVLLGLLGVVGWLLLFKFRKKPPQLDIPAFLVQLVFAHIVFSVSATAVFRFFFY